jgi:sugar-specific transcriptional regulator TrmB
MNSRSYLRSLTDLGLKPFEAKVYLACIELGQSNVTRISEQAEVSRTFCYEVLGELIDRGLVSRVKTKGVQQFSPLSLDKFHRLQEEKLRRFEEVLPEMRALQMTVGDAPKVQFLSGMEGIKAAFEDTLETLDKGGEILIYTTAEGYYDQEQAHFRSYVKRRIAKKISVRFIGGSTHNISLFTENNEKELRDFRLVPADRFPFANEINIYGNKVAIMSMRGELMAVIIESESVAATQRAIFELAWLGTQAV